MRVTAPVRWLFVHRPWFVRGDIEATVGSMLSCLVTLMIIISVCYVRRVDLSGDTICVFAAVLR